MKRFQTIASNASFVLIFGYGATLVAIHVVTAISEVL